MNSAQDADIRLFCAGDMVAFAGEHPLVQGKYRKIGDKSHFTSNAFRNQ